jgi:erythromycin esterase-like protein
VTDRSALQNVGWVFTEDGGGLSAALTNFLDTLATRPRLLALGEPTHGVEAFPLLRNQVFRHLVEHEGYRSMAIESDCLAGLRVDDFVAAGTGSLDGAMSTGFSHGFGDSLANRELVAWMREYNHDTDSRLTFYGFDAPIENFNAGNPHTPLIAVHSYLATVLDHDRLPGTAAEINDLVGDETRWTRPEAVLDPTQSLGASDEVARLRVIADDLTALLVAEAPRLIAATANDQWWRARLHARTAAGVLRYHAATADGSASRVSRLLAVRDAMMADNLADIAEREARRGPTLVFAHNSHLQREQSTMQLREMALAWWSAGAIIATQLGDRYAFIATGMASAPGKQLDTPGPDTLEGLLAELPGDRRLFDADRLDAALQAEGIKPSVRTDLTPQQGFALDPEHLKDTDGVAFIRTAH